MHAMNRAVYWAYTGDLDMEEWVFDPVEVAAVVEGEHQLVGLREIRHALVQGEGVQLGLGLGLGLGLVLRKLPGVMKKDALKVA